MTTNQKRRRAEAVAETLKALADYHTDATLRCESCKDGGYLFAVVLDKTIRRKYMTADEFVEWLAGVI